MHFPLDVLFSGRELDALLVSSFLSFSFYVVSHLAGSRSEFCPCVKLRLNTFVDHVPQVSFVSCCDCDVNDSHDISSRDVNEQHEQSDMKYHVNH